MFRKALLALILILGSSSAWAQNPQCPTRPIGDSSNACASTAFVQSAINAVCSITPTTCARIVGHVSIAWYGAVCDGVTNDTTAIQNAWNAAAALNLNVWLGTGTGISASCNLGTGNLTMPTPTNQGGGGGFSKASQLHGPGSGLLRLLSSATAGNCVITISLTYGLNSSLGGIMGGFTLYQGNTNQTGYGICLTNVTLLNMDDIAIQYFEQGVRSSDGIAINMTRMWFELNGTGVRAFYTSTAPANAWNIINSNFDGHTGYAIAITGTSTSGAKNFNIDHSTFQTNGTAGGTGTIYNQFDCAIYGGVGLNITNNYFEGDIGAEITFDAGSAANMACVHNVKNNYFVRSLSGLSSGVLIANSGSGTYQVTVNVEGNYFSDVLLTGASYQWLQFTSSGTFNSTFICDGNVANVAAEINSRCGKAAASKTKSSDANAQWVGYN